jgi:hypothetical protein
VECGIGLRRTHDAGADVGSAVTAMTKASRSRASAACGAEAGGG